MIILSVDPSYTATGYAVIKKEQNKQFLQLFGFLPLPAKNIMQNRIGIFYDFFDKMIVDQKITHLALETPFLGKNAQTFLKLGYLRGVLHVLAYRHNITLLEFSPKEIKTAVTGFGGAEKEQVARMIYMLFPGIQTQKSHDVTDAIAIGLCGLWHNPRVQF